MNLVRGRRVDPGAETVREFAGEDAALHEIAEFMGSSRWEEEIRIKITSKIKRRSEGGLR